MSEVIMALYVSGVPSRRAEEQKKAIGNLPEKADPAPFRARLRRYEAAR